MDSPVRVLLVGSPGGDGHTARQLDAADGRFDVCEVTAAESVLERLTDEHVDCVVSAYRLSGTDGLSLLETVREFDAELPFVLVTDDASEAVASAAISAGVSEYVRREAMDGQVLAERIRHAVDVHRERRARRRRDELFELTQHLADTGGWEYDLRTGENVWTSGMYEIYEVPATFDPSFESEVALYHAEDRETLRAAFGRAVSDAEPYDLELRLLSDDEDGDETADAERWVRVRGVPAVVDEEVVAVRGTAWDVTERKDRERALEESRERYRSLFENNPLVIWEEDFSECMRYLAALDEEVDDLEAYLRAHPGEVGELLDRIEVIDVNQNTLDRLGASSKAELLDNLDQVFADEAIDAFISEVLAFANGETAFRWETVARTLDGERREELLEAHVPDRYADDYSRVYVSGMDITERKAQEHELQRKNERLEEFASIVSHDLRNPLQVAISRLEAARTECESVHLDEIATAHERMRELIDDLLTLAREGEVVSETEAVALGETVEHCWQTVAVDGGSLVVESDAVVRADESRLQQLFENLFRNAVEHTPDDVTITVGDLDGGFYVADDGPGIPPDEREDVFEYGYSSADGTGFGLAIVRSIVDAHGWSIRATESEAGGARFEITDLEPARETNA